MAGERVRVWAGDDREVQHFADPPARDTIARTWDGAAVCGAGGPLRWVHAEIVDEGATCPECLRLEGTYRPLLEGDYPGPP